MPLGVDNTALVKCAFGAAPMPLTVLPVPRTTTMVMPVGQITDFAPMLNIPSFVMCTAPTNPQVIAQLGAPAQCTPVVVAPWIPTAPTKLIGGSPVLTNASMAFCMWAGMIEVLMPGQFTVNYM